MIAGTTRVPRTAIKTRRSAERKGRLRKTYVTIPDTIRVRMSRDVFIDVAIAQPRRRPATKTRQPVTSPAVRMTRAMHQKAVHRLSVRYSSDFRKKVGKRLRRRADQTPTRVEYSRLPSTQVAQMTTANSSSIGARM